MQIGYALSSEEHCPLDLVDFAVRAEEVGFDFAMISDHFHPWLDAQGQSPFVWSVLGAIASRTERLRVGTGVTCPLIRMHPAIVAQAAATTAAMLPGRFWFGVGTGENLNEHILGVRWPSASERRAMLHEAIALMRELWTGELVSHAGDHFQLVDARLYTLPEEPIEILVAAGGERAAALAAELDAGLVATAPERTLVAAYEDGGGSGPRLGQLTVCWAESEQSALETAMRWWPNAALKGPLSQELALPGHFEQSLAMIDEQQLSESVICGPDGERILAGIRTFEQAGFESVYLHQVGPDQEGFLAWAGEAILPAVTPSSR